jgi:hypothetical protein
MRHVDGIYTQRFNRQHRRDGYATVSWNCRVVESKMAKEMKSKDRIEQIVASISQL